LQVIAAITARVALFDIAAGPLAMLTTELTVATFIACCNALRSLGEEGGGEGR
jgi:hypothetical protein